MKELLLDHSDDEVQRMQLKKTNETLLLHSIEKGQLELVKYFEGRGLSVLDKGGLFNQTGITRATLGGHWEVFQHCVEQGGELQIESDKNFTLLHWAVYGGNENIVRYLLEHGLDIEAKSHVGHTALMTGAILGQAGIGSCGCFVFFFFFFFFFYL
jgi:ankyrin repeat protein